MIHQQNTKTQYDGKRFKITNKKHPWTGSIATCLGERILGGDKWYFIMKDSETGIEFGVDVIKKMKLID